MIDAAERMRAWVSFYLDAIDLGLSDQKARDEASDMLRAFDRAIQSEEDECVTE